MLFLLLLLLIVLLLWIPYMLRLLSLHFLSFLIQCFLISIQYTSLTSSIIYMSLLLIFPSCIFLQKCVSIFLIISHVYLISICACVLSCFSHVWLFVTLWTVAHQAPLSMGFSRQEYWNELPCPPPGDLPNPGIKPESLKSPALAGGFFTHWAT